MTMPATWGKRTFDNLLTAALAAVIGFSGWGRRVGLARKLTISLALGAIVSGVATYLCLTGGIPIASNQFLLRGLLLSDLVILLLLSAVVAQRVVRLWLERRSGVAGSKLHVRVVLLFSIVAVMPAIIVSVFSALFFNYGLQVWFSKQVVTAVNESVAVAEAYMHEHRRAIKADVLAMAADLNRDAPELANNPALFNRVINAQVQLRSLSEAMVFDSQGDILARSSLSFLMEFDKVPEWALEKAAKGDVVVLTSDNEDRVRALVRLDDFLDSYLYVGRLIEPEVIAHLERARQAAAAYRRLEAERPRIEVTFALIYIVVSLLTLLAAVTFGLAIATRLIRPISNMIAAAERVRSGDLSARVPVVAADDEMANLGHAFNRMTMQLEAQRTELVLANREMVERRRFIEAVLAGVSAAVIGLDDDGRVTVANPSAVRFLGTAAEDLIGLSVTVVMPGMEQLLRDAQSHPERPVEGQITVVRNGRPRHLSIGIAADREGGVTQGYVVSFDDITELVSAQRTAAWADVARRIAHEIKNPLTPIQLSAERLRRKYLKEISSDPDVFSKCTDTIIRQVGDLRRMVDEFSAFARLPAPVFKWENLNELIRQGLVLQQLANPDIDYIATLPEQPVMLRCDSRQIAQVLTNLLQNAAQSIEAHRATEVDAPRGRIIVHLALGPGAAILDVVDNGRGLPAEERDHLTEPYVTTRAKGSGLGLAIVKKIMEDHNGTLLLEDVPEGGARIRLVFRIGEGEEDSMGKVEQRIDHGA